MVGVGKFSGFDASQKATITTTNEGSGAQIAPKGKNLKTVGKLLKKVRLIVMGEMDK